MKYISLVLLLLTCPGARSQNTPFPDIFCRDNTGLSVRNLSNGVQLDYTALDDDDAETVNFIHDRFAKIGDAVTKAGSLAEACKLKDFPAIFCAQESTLSIIPTDNGAIIRLIADDEMNTAAIKAIHMAFRAVMDQLATTGGDAGQACRSFGSSSKADRPGAPFVLPRASGTAFDRRKAHEAAKEEDNQRDDFVSVNDD